MTMGHGLYGLQESRLPPPPPSRWRWVWRVVLGGAVLMTGSLTTLYLIGGNSNDMKLQVEQYLGESTGLKTTIGTLNHFTFFPSMAFDADNIIMARATPQNPDEKMVEIGNIRISVGFWSVASGSTKFQVLEIHNADIQPGVVAPRHIHIDRAGIAPEQSAFIAQAAYGGEKIDLHIDLAAKPGKILGVPSYRLAKDAGMELNAGDIVIKAVLNRVFGGGFSARISELRAGKMVPVSGDLVVAGALKGKLLSGQSDFTLNVPFEKRDDVWEFTGKISGQNLVYEDVLGNHGVMQGYRALGHFIAGPDKEKNAAPDDFDGMLADIDVSYKNFSQGGAIQGGLDGKLTVDDGQAIFTSVPDGHRKK